MRKILSAILAAVMLFSTVSVWAFAAEGERTVRTTTLKIDSFDEDKSNEDEGWSWDKETTTLTLDNVRFETKDEPCLLIRTGVKIMLIGDNTFTADLSDPDMAAVDSVVLDYYGLRSSPNFYGDSLTVNASNGFAMRTENVQNYGASLAINGKIHTESLTVWSGKTEINAAETEEGYCLKTTDSVYVASGELVLRPGNNAGIIIELLDVITSITEGFGIRNDGSLTCIGGVCAVRSGSKGRVDTYIETKGTITLKDCQAGFVQGIGRAEYKSGKIVTELEPEKIFVLEEGCSNALLVGPADYTAVREAIIRIPANLDNFRKAGVEALQAALDAVDYDLDAYAQYKVDEYAANIISATENLEELPWIIRFFRSIADFFENLFK
ncbi:MAG: hypothetical protein IJB45_03970 [Clostridia bacterium]|nr:hypothetical protein [Clostridia bacterium]